MILFNEIYEKSVHLFGDPKITQAYKTNQIQFCKIMYNYLQNAVALFNNPLIVTSKLTAMNLPSGLMEKFTIENSTLTEDNKYSFNLDPEFELLDNSLYNFIEGDLLISNGILDKENKIVIFPDKLPQGQEYAFEQYFPGAFTTDFKNFNVNTTGINEVVKNIVKDILARLLVKCWAEEERNLVLDIRNLLQDSDFKLMSNSAITRSKNEWVNQLDTEIHNLQNRLSWSIRFAGSSLVTGIGIG